MVESFDGYVVSDLSQNSLVQALEGMNGQIKTIINTLPTATAEFELPRWLVNQSKDAGSRTGAPIIVDVNYKPSTTKVLSQAEKADFDVVRGSEILWEQGVAQFQLWTGRPAPYKIMKDIVLDNCL